MNAQTNLAPPPRCTYILPIRRTRASDTEMQDFADYFQLLAATRCEVLVVDGSPPEVFAEHGRAWHGICRHATVAPQYKYSNGKVNGVHTGVDLAACEAIIIGDDDIRYTADDIARMYTLLDEYEMVRPQNYLSPLPWWARMEAARMLLNRALIRTGDYPGTCGFRRSTMRRVGHFDGDVLFDNEEIVRHFALHGAKIAYARGFFVFKHPPTLGKWREQRPRQAYEDFVMRLKTVFFLALLPSALVLSFFAAWRTLVCFSASIAVGSIWLALRGRSEGAHRFFPWWICCYAPLWIIERAASVYWALYWRVVYGGYPFGARIVAKGTGRAWVEGGRASLQTFNRNRH